MIIKRDSYLSQLINLRHNGMIKIVTGIRRCGKSFLLDPIFSSWLLAQGVDGNHIIMINLEDRRNKKLRDPDALLEYIDSRLTDDRMHYILIDEIQLVPDFEDVLNSYLRVPNADVYVTGSNSRFLSSDIITEFRGRGEEIKMFPLSFKEYFSFRNDEPSQALMEYMTYGGLPPVVLKETHSEKSKTLKTIFSRVYLRDIIDRNKIKRTEILEEFVNILASAIGGLTNLTKLQNTFKSLKHIEVSRNTLEKYLDCLKDSFIIEEVERFDIKGKRYINALHKYYFGDCGLRNARLNFRQIEYTHLLENVIYIELLIRGFSVDVGIVRSNVSEEEADRYYEVDFVCNQGSRRYYIQSAFRMPDEEKLKQESASLLKIEDTFKKVIILGEHTPVIHTPDGITIISIYDFLLKDNALEL